MPQKIAPLLALVLCLGAGCSQPEYEIAPVEGVVMIKGKPGHKINLQFVPDIDKGAKGPSSFAQTDAEGKFTLQLQSVGQDVAKSKPGAVVGWHRVVLSDLQLAESATGRGVPIRLDSTYTLPGSTPLRQEVKPGANAITLELP
jgi:hypothetical protein